MSSTSPATKMDDRSVMMSKRTLQWISSNIPATSVGDAMATIVPPSSELVSGITVQKITSRGNMKHRVITVSRDNFALFCTHQPIEKGIVQGVMSNVAQKLPLPMISRKGIWGWTPYLRDRYVRYIDVADIDYVCTGTVSTRKLEQTRTGNRLKGFESKIDMARQEIVTIGHHGDQTLDILVKNETERQQLLDCIQNMRETFHRAQALVSHEALLLRYIWYDVDTNRDGFISEKEFVKIMGRINFNVKQPGKEFRKFVKERNLKKAISLEHILELLMTIKNQEGNGSTSMANMLWGELFGSNTSIVDAPTFLKKFIHGIQGETSKNLTDTKELINTINSMEIDHKLGEPDKNIVDEQISRPRFEVYLYHELNDAYDPQFIESEKTLLLDQPMSHYFVNTSHNTYLTGDQLQSNSSVEMYARALRRGCKCLELDCWDGETSKSKELYPVVFHGHTLTSKILFADILQVVKNYLIDHPKSYPIILSLENHCSRRFQSAMATSLVDTFGEMLYIPLENLSEDLPSPEKLRGMVVIKGKRPPEADDSPVDIDYDDKFDPYEVSANEESETKSQRKDKDDPSGKPAKPPSVVEELARLTLFHGTKFKEFEQSIAEPQSHMHSISESKITKILSKSANNGLLWRQYNVTHMTRTYPAGARLDSSNYNPILPWAVGCQLVALNFQTNDVPLVLNDGLFRQNSGIGYLPKPSAYLNENPPPLTDLSKPVMMLKIRVLSGSCLPKPYGAKDGELIDPYIQIMVHDVKTSDSGNMKAVASSHVTNTVGNNGFCPVWNEKTAKSFPVHSPEIAMIQFTLRERDIGLDDNVAYAAIPICCFRKGYRSIQLYDSHNTRTGPFSYASLLIEIQITEI